MSFGRARLVETIASYRVGECPTIELACSFIESETMLRLGRTDSTEHGQQPVVAEALELELGNAALTLLLASALDQLSISDSVSSGAFR